LLALRRQKYFREFLALVVPAADVLQRQGFAAAALAVISLQHHNDVAWMRRFAKEKGQP
jgi:hypothetical protein